MTRFVLQRAGVALARFGAIAFGLLVLVEIAYCGVGGSGRHVWLADSFGPAAPLFPPEVLAAIGRSTGAFLLAYGLVLATGYGWGTLAARYRRFKAVPLLEFPFSVLACAPGFWLVLLVVVHAVYTWQRPGFADGEPPVEAASLFAWWHVAVLAAVAASSGVVRLMSGVASILKRFANQPYLRNLYIRGYASDAIFYGNAFRQARTELAGLLDKPVPGLLGVLAVLETAYRFEGAGALFVDSVRNASYAGVVAAGSWMAAVSVALTFVRELIEEGVRYRAG